ncbi:MAG: nucleotidyl transferase AbiEii/AbiGii toxin family protein [Thermodesulfovibrionales bacterium]
MNKELDRALTELCDAFNRYGVKYVVVGGFAVIMHGLARMTEDIDFFIEDSAENIEKIKNALKSLYHDPFIDELKSEDIKQYAVIRYGTPDNFNIDLIGKIGEEMILFKDVERDTEFFEIDDLKIPVCSLDMLIRMKETIRYRDMRDLRFLKKKLEERKRSGL